jgi:hypothetical protein
VVDLGEHTPDCRVTRVADAQAPASVGRPRVVLWLTLAVLALPFIVLFVRVVMSPWLPTSDLAAIELRVRDVGGAHTPLLGVYSRYGWNHPGPLLFYVLALPYRALGSPTWGLLAGAVLVNAAAVGGCAWLLWRRGGVAGLLFASVPLVLLLHALGGTFLQYPWNPYVVVLVLFVLALTAWSVAAGDHWLLPLAVALATFVIQAHVGTLLPAAALVLVAVVFFAWDARAGRVRHTSRVALIGAGVGVALWLPAIIQELQSGRGNLTELWDFWTSKQSPTPGLATGARLVAPQLGPAPSFVTGHESLGAFTASVDPGWTVPIALVLLLGATAVAFARRDRPSFTLDVIALTLVAAAWLSAARIVGEPFFYIVRWTWIVGAIAWLAIGWTTVRAGRTQLSPARLPSVATAGGAIAAALVVVLIAASTVAAVRSEPPDQPEANALRRLDGPTIAALTPHNGPVLVRPAGSTFLGAVLARGLLLRLARKGIDAGLDPADENVVGSAHVVAPRDATAEIVVASEPDEIDQYRADAHYREITSYDSLTRAARADYDALRGRVASDPTDLVSWIHAHPDEWARYRALDRRALHTVVFERV